MFMVAQQVGIGFALVFVSIGLVALWQLIGTTTISLRGDELMVTHGPLSSLRRAQRMRVRDVRQLAVRDLLSRNEDGEVDCAYELIAVDRTGVSTPIALLPDLGAARFVEQQVETLLGIEDARVPGEIPPPARR